MKPGSTFLMNGASWAPPPVVVGGARGVAAPGVILTGGEEAAPAPARRPEDFFALQTARSAWYQFPGEAKCGPLFFGSVPNLRRIPGGGGSDRPPSSSPPSPSDLSPPPEMLGAELGYALRARRWLKTWDAARYEEAPEHARDFVATSISLAYTKATELHGDGTITNELVAEVYRSFEHDGLATPVLGFREDPIAINVKGATPHDDVEIFMKIAATEVLEQLTAVQVGALRNIQGDGEVGNSLVELAMALIATSLRRDLRRGPYDRYCGWLTAKEVDRIVKAHFPAVQVAQRERIRVYDRFNDITRTNRRVGHSLLTLVKDRVASVEWLLRQRLGVAHLHPLRVRAIARDLVTWALIPAFESLHVDDGEVDAAGVAKVFARHGVGRRFASPLQIYYAGDNEARMLECELRSLISFFPTTLVASKEVIASLAFSHLLRARARQGYLRVKPGDLRPHGRNPAEGPNRTYFLWNVARRMAAELGIPLRDGPQLGGHPVSLPRLARRLGISEQRLDRLLDEDPQRFEDLAEAWSSKGEVESFIARHLRVR